MDSKALLVASFDERLKTYELLIGVIILLSTFIGIPLIALWLLGIGQYVSAKRFESLDCVLTERSLNFSKGVLLRVQKNVPLDKITDLAVIEGPILRRFGLVRLHVETAGQSGQGALVSLIGIENAMDFRDAVLTQRDRVTVTGGSAERPSEGDPILVDIRDTLHRIEAALKER